MIPELPESLLLSRPDERQERWLMMAAHHLLAYTLKAHSRGFLLFPPIFRSPRDLAADI
jgi:hypothetical protein